MVFVQQVEWDSHEFFPVQCGLDPCMHNQVTASLSFLYGLHSNTEIADTNQAAWITTIPHWRAV